MKRKYLSALLMGTLTVASMSTFTSCKDYDDDISNLQGQIDKLATADQLSQKVAELQALISSNQTGISSLETKLAEVKATADSKATLDQVKDILAGYATNESVTKEANEIVNAAIKALQEKDIKDLKALIETAQGKADQAVKDAADAKAEILKTLEDYALKSDVDAAQGTADDALAKAIANKTAIENALKTLGTGFDEKNTVAAAIEAINGQLTAKDTGLAGLDGRLSVIEAALKSDESGDKLTNLKLKIDNIENKLKDIIGQYSTMVTDVQLFNFAVPNYSGFDRTLRFVQAAEKANVFPAQAGVATEQLKFEEGKYYAGDDSLLIRVSPVDAELTTSNVSLMNSQGKELDDLIEVTDVHRYNKLLLGSTRAADNDAKSGLWVVKFKAKDLGDNFEAAAATKDEYGNTRSILYSVAVKNTYNTTDKAEDAKTRRVTSEFGVDLNTSDAEHAWDFEVNGKSVANIHNRYIKTESYEYTDMKSGSYAKTYAEELVWKADPATTVVTNNADPTKNNAVDRKGHTYDQYGWGNYDGTDNRQWENILAVEKGKPIKIDFTNSDVKGVKGFYVTLDERFAQESAPSELNAWNSYEYENVGYKNQPAKLFKGSTGTITIKDMNNVQGDIIGFRVYAVNYDGTLYDPDGRSFYVAVGDVKKELSLGNSKLTVNASNKFESTVALPADFSKYDFNGNTGWKVTEEDADGKKPTDFTVKYYNAKGEEISLSKDVRSIKFILNNPMAFIDDATYNVSMTLTNTISSATANVCTVNASFTKEMPDDAPAFCYRDGFTKNPEYIIPDGNSYVVTSSNKGGTFNFRNILIINNNKEWKTEDLMDAITNGKFKFNVANGTYDNDKKLAKAETVNTQYILNVNNSGETNLVDNKTERTIAADYIYSNISKCYDTEAKAYVTGNYPVPSKSTEKIVYCSWMKTFSYDAESKIVEETQADKTKKKVQKNTWWLNNTVNWNKTTGAAQPLDLNNLAVSIADVKLLPVAFPAGVSKVKFGEFLTKNVLKVVPGQYGDIYTTGTGAAKEQINPYFKATISGSTISLEQISQTQIPSSVTGGLIHFTVKDCFGNTMPVVLPFQIKVNGVAAKKH